MACMQLCPYLNTTQSTHHTHPLTGAHAALCLPHHCQFKPTFCLPTLLFTSPPLPLAPQDPKALTCLLYHYKCTVVLNIPLPLSCPSKYDPAACVPHHMLQYTAALPSFHPLWAQTLPPANPTACPRHFSTPSPPCVHRAKNRRLRAPMHVRPYNLCVHRARHRPLPAPPHLPSPTVRTLHKTLIPAYPRGIPQPPASPRVPGARHHHLPAHPTRPQAPCARPSTVRSPKHRALAQLGPPSCTSTHFPGACHACLTALRALPASLPPLAQTLRLPTLGAPRSPPPPIAYLGPDTDACLSHRISTGTVRSVHTGGGCVFWLAPHWARPPRLPPLLPSLTADSGGVLCCCCCCCKGPVASCCPPLGWTELRSLSVVSASQPLRAGKASTGRGWRKSAARRRTCDIPKRLKSICARNTNPAGACSGVGAFTTGRIRRELRHEATRRSLCPCVQLVCTACVYSLCVQLVPVCTAWWGKLTCAGPTLGGSCVAVGRA